MDIVQDILTDSARGARRLEKEYKAQLYAVALRLGADPEEAEALAWRTIDEAVRRIGDYTEQSAFFAWLCKILVNCRSKSLRRKSNERILYTDELPETSEDVDGGGASGVVQAVDAGILRDAIESLPEEMKEAVILRYFMDVPIRKMAQIFSVPVGTVKSRLYYARIVLARRLGVSLKKHAVALVAATLFLLAGAATVKAIVRAAVAENEDGRLQAVDIIEPTSGDAIPGGTAFISSDSSHAESDLSRPSAASQPSFAKAKGENPLNLSAAKGKEDMNIRQQAATALAAATLAASSASATTVAWYHFNEGESGEIAAGGQPVVLNAVDPTSLAGTPYVATGKAAVSVTGNNLPAYTNDMPSGVSWYDPVTGARGSDNRSLFLRTNNRKGSYGASTVLIDDNEALHCQNITVEMMIKASPEATVQYNTDWIHALSMVSDVANNKRAWGIMIRGKGEMFCYMDNYKDSTKSINGYNGDPYFYSAWVSGSIPKITDGKWHHLAMTYDGETVRLYVDYTERGSCAYAGPIAYNDDCNGKLSIGPNYANNYGGWDGFIDEVRISNDALPPEKFLRIGGLDNNASDADTVVYLPLNSLEFSTDNFFSTVGQPILLNSACSTNAGLVNVKLSTVSYGLLPRLDTGVSAVVADELHAGVFATKAIPNEGCWTFTNNQMVAGTAIQTGKSRSILIDDYSNNNGVHLISSGDFTAEFYLKLLERPTRTTRLLCENSGASGAGTLDFRVEGTGLTCVMISQAELDKLESGASSSAKSITLSTPVDDMVDDAWHHVALVVDRANRRVTMYLDGSPVATQNNFVLASSVSTKSDNYKTLKIGDGWGGNNMMGFHNMSIDEYRITRRALAPQEFLMAGAALADGALEPIRAWIGFEGDLSVEPKVGLAPEGTAPAAVVYSPVVPGERIVDGSGGVIRSANLFSMKFSASGRVFVDRNILLEKEMTSQTVEFFMKGTNGSAKAWAYFVRLYSNTTGAENDGERMWSIGYSDSAGHLYVAVDNNGSSQPTCYVDSDFRFADGHWHHVAVTFEPDGNGNTRCKVYRDHVPVQLYYYVGSTKMPLSETHTFSGLLEMGEHDYSCMALGNNYDGWLDEVRISKGVLTVDQMMHVIKRGMVISFR